MARFVMNSTIAERRGLSSKAAKLTVATTGPVNIRWATPEDNVGRDEMTIEHDANERMSNNNNAEPMRKPEAAE
jgi:hypothetical protein